VIVQIVSLEVKPGMVEEFLAGVRINHAGTRQEPGNAAFDVLRDPDDACRFVIYEAFDSEEAIAAHREAPHYKQCMGLITPLLAGSRTMKRYEPLMADYLA
jgi:autoinducer 2-degrading protein